MADDDKKVADEPAEEPKANDKPAKEPKAKKPAAPAAPAADDTTAPADDTAAPAAPTDDAAPAGTDQQGRQLYDVKCASCGKDAQVPFKPSGDRPVYCRDCYMQKRGGGN